MRSDFLCELFDLIIIIIVNDFVTCLPRQAHVLVIEPMVHCSDAFRVEQEVEINDVENDEIRETYQASHL